MKRFETETCIKFVPLKTRVYNTYIEIGSTKKGCYAMIGYHPQKNGQGLPVNFQLPECTAHQGTIEHELLHVIGILHEQARSDRDEHVTIVWENIEKGKIHHSYKESKN
ncbi:zinc metalloproteinase nas-4-like [Diaphorina citri]|uniref:Metalloendopeptidase n=1 Tax=Diaphorina citri TaxID=121845 RepID=A0A3Q0JEG2_DIACI|nr:zinc metalloproteinase nas-4-like [Diaphorina citri]